MAGDVLLWIGVLVLVLVGLAGTALPALPGPILVAAGLLLGAWIDGFERVGLLPLVTIGVLTGLCYAADLAATALGAKRVGASPRAAWGAALGMLVGMFFGLVGLVLGPFVGAVLGEYSVRRNLDQASRAGLGAWLGIVLGLAAKMGLIGGMLGVFGFAYWW